MSIDFYGCSCILFWDFVHTPNEVNDMKKLETAAVLGLIGAIFCGNLSGFQSTVETLKNEVLRLHILANSDSPEDQSLKLMVREVGS